SDVGMWPAVIRILLSTIYAVRGQTDAAVQTLSAAADLAERVPDPQITLVARSIEGVLHEERGELRQAEATYRRGLAFAATPRMEQLAMGGYAYVGLGSVAFARNELDDGEKYIRQGLTLGGTANAADVYLRGTRLLSHIRLAHGDRDSAQALLDEMSRFARNVS